MRPKLNREGLSGEYFPLNFGLLPKISSELAPKISHSEKNRKLYYTVASIEFLCTVFYYYHGYTLDPTA